MVDEISGLCLGNRLYSTIIKQGSGVEQNNMRIVTKRFLSSKIKTIPSLLVKKEIVKYVTYDIDSLERGENKCFYKRTKKGLQNIKIQNVSSDTR